MSQIIEDLLRVAVAEADAHVREVGGNNRGPRVEEFLAAAGGSAGDPWCLAFVCWCMGKAGVKGWPQTAFCPNIWQWASDNGVLHNGQHEAPQRGDVMLLMDAEGRMGAFHTGIVESVDGGRVNTLEGNTGDGNVADGDGVYRRNRAASSCDFVRWADLLTSAEGATFAPPPPAALSTIKAFFRHLPDGTVRATIDLPDGRRVSGPVWGKMATVTGGMIGDFRALADVDLVIRFRDPK